jgi:type I restriction enzyme S subunit
MTEQTDLVPKRRFKGFLNSQAWEQREFGDMYDLVSGFAFKMSDYVQVGVPIINGESIQHGDVITSKLNFLPKEFLDRYQNFIVNSADIVLGLNRPITNGNLKIAQVPRELQGSLLYQRAGKVIILNNSDINFSYQLLGKEVLKFVLKEAVGSDQPFISTAKLKKWLLYVPVIKEEQLKIGKIFTQLDNLITLHQRKLEKTKALKAAYLSEMFPAEGESEPKRRFAGFTGAWEQRRLGELCDKFQSGKNIKSEDIRDEGGYPVFGGNGFRGYTNTYNHDGLYALIGRQGALCGNMNISYGKAYFTEHAVVVKGNKNNETSFLFYLLGKMNLGQYSGQSAQPGLAVNKLIELTAFVPTFAEQGKISVLFKHLDDTITLHQRKLEKLQNLKKAFLNEMFV